MEAAIRTAHYMITGKEMDELKVKKMRGMKDRKETKIKIGDLELGVAAVSGLANARKLLDEIKAGRDDIHFIEVMSCPGGCVGGGGQPINLGMDTVRKRMKAIYKVDQGEMLRASHANPSIKRIYEEFLGEPNGPKCHKLLHTHYTKRDVML